MPQALKMTLIAIASAIAGAALVNQYNNNYCQVDIPSQQKATLTDEKIAQLQQENMQLSAQLKQQNSRTSAPTNPIADTARHQQRANSSQSLPENSKVDEYVLRKSERFSKWLEDTLKENGNVDLNKEMQRRFDAEAIDPVWAAAEEQEYFSLFSQNPELSGLALRETQCRTQQCVITVSVTDLDQANQLAEKMASVLRQKNKYPMIIAATDEQQGITKLYIGKDETSFDFN
ncbi:hypothetical protein J2X05_000496 [Cellvibrio fibrivorans]|uniref:Toxin co-regulated pilus biosynthesis protein Q C-terminal domain-containing protein n=2 Tax=Cellvibrio fibrivorans TaxID=126350 RepID=A0ABU1UTI8_9GAMM|nr:hypothetical protein [Cellvibrio fibrivorans]